MKHTLITSLSPQQQYEIRRWTVISITGLTVSAIIGLSFVVPPLYSLYGTYKEIAEKRKKLMVNNNIDATLSKQKKEYEELHKKYDKVMRSKNNPKNPITYLELIMESLKNMTVEKITKHKRSLEITALCTTPHDATAFIENLVASKQYKSVKLISLQQDVQTNRFRCFIQGVIA
jgi:hypothetical protein